MVVSRLTEGRPLVAALSLSLMLLPSLLWAGEPVDRLEVTNARGQPRILLADPVWAGAPASDRLEVSNAGGRLLAVVPMPVGAGWCLAWNHSVEGFPVHDCYRNEAGHMVLERSHLPDFAAGLDHIPGRGRQVSDGQGGYWIEDIDEPVPGDAYLLRVGAPRVDHRLVSHGEPSLAALLRRGGQTDDGPRADPPFNDDGEPAISLSELAAGERVTIRLRPSEPSS